MADTKAIAIFHGLGDCINATTLLKPLKIAYPKSKLVWVSSERYLPVVAHNPLIDETIGIPGNPWKADSEYANLKKKYATVITPAPYLWHPSKRNILLESYEDRIKHYTRKKARLPLEPLLYMLPEEVQAVDAWLEENEIGNYVLLETNFTSSQSFWDITYTKLALKILAEKGYTALLAHRGDPHLEEYNKICRTFCLNFNFRLMPRFYNRASGFIGVSSGISCVVHTHQCSVKVPHLEFVKGEHWCTRKYPKKNKVISFNSKADNVRHLIRTRIPTL